MKLYLVNTSTGDLANSVELPDDWDAQDPAHWQVPEGFHVVDPAISGDMNFSYTPEPWFVMKLTIVRRLNAAGLWDLAKQAFDGNPYLKDEWDAAVEIASNDPVVEGLLIAIGANPEEILAP